MTKDQLAPEEFNPYFSTYINKVGDDDLISSLNKGSNATTQFFESIPKNKLEYMYAPGKWTPKEILLHIIDTERVFSTRALYFARSKDANLSSYDENVFAKNSNANSRSIANILEEYKAVRKATVLFFENLSEDALKGFGKASGSTLSARAAGFIISGHEIHHMQVIKERYL